ncbi:unnamed protein product [Lasius platythorax]|uniref:Nuclease HARBI1 n=1 Tax=Lasius platythorax TaxID=488582 RepID=A0AAV2MVY0_9HYME
MDFEEPRNVEIPDIHFYSEEEEEEDELQIRLPKKYIRYAQNPFDIWNDIEFKKRFRFSKESIMFGILPLIEEGLAKINNRGLPISPVMQLLICLRFYATTSFQLIVGDVIRISQATISRIIYRVSTLLASNINKYIRMPISEEAKSENQRLFKEIGYGPGAIGFPSINGAIDCTHVRLIRTRLLDIEEIFRNRKGYFSLNVQAIVGPRTEFLDIPTQHMILFVYTELILNVL